VRNPVSFRQPELFLLFRVIVRVEVLLRGLFRLSRRITSFEGDVCS